MSERASPPREVIIAPEAEALSPDDGQALISMNLIHIGVSTPQEAEQMGKAFKKWWYVVSTASGRVLREYRTSPPPVGWWVRKELTE